MRMNKKGVSLITVLLFMMIATIAATATYKWLTSEGSSSGSRMKMNEARQAAVAGIDAARSWMSYNANDVGDVVRQFYAKQNTDEKFVKLNGVLQNISGDNQNFDVYLVGVDNSRSTYRMKLVSVGRGRNGTKYSEAAILDVSGLYRVKIPAQKASTPANFKEALYAGTTGGVSVDISSGIVNGDMSLNTETIVNDHLLVTGSLNVNSATKIKDLYVNKSLLTCTNFDVTGDAYVEDQLYINGVATFGGLYAGGGLDITGSGGVAPGTQCGTGSGNQLTVTKNLTIDGDLLMPTHTAGQTHEVKGNLVILNGRMVFPSSDYTRSNTLLNQPYYANFLGNVYIEGGITGEHIHYKNADHIKLGSSGKKVYTGDTPLYRVSSADAGPGPDKQGKGKIVYTWWLTKSGENSIYINADGKYLSEDNTSWDNRLDEKSWKGKLELPPKNTYCNSDKCVPTVESTKPNFWQNPILFDLTKGSPVSVGTEVRCNATWTWMGWQYPYGCTYNASLGYWTRTATEVYTPCTSPWPGNTECKYTQNRYYHCLCESYDIYRNEAFVQVNGSVVSAAPSDTAGWRAERMQKYADEIEKASTSDKCETDYVKEPIQFNNNLFSSEYLHSADKQGACANLGVASEHYTDGSLWKTNNSRERWTLLEECYDLASAHGELYQDEWLLIKLKGSEGQLHGAITSGKKLTKKYIIILEEEAYITPPPTSTDGIVMLYMQKGGTIEMPGAATSDVRNYFIYSKGNIQYNNAGNNLINGSVFLADCKKIQSVNIIRVNYSENLVSALEGAAALCGNDGTEVCTIGSTSGSSGGASGSGTDVSDGMDSYYVATSPQLNVTLVSQYKNDEMDPSSSNDNISPSVIVMPRVVYLSQDAEGKLSDYYTVLPLNKFNPDDVSNGVMSCPADIPTATNLVSESQLLKKGYYTCTYQNGNTSVPLYVVVQNQRGENPTVTLDDDEKEVAANSTEKVYLVAPSGNRQIKIRASIPSENYLPNGWSYTAKNGGTKVDDNGTYAVYSFPAMTPTGTNIELFEITTQSSAAQGEVRVFLDDCEGCNIGQPRSERVFLNGHVDIVREEITETFCGTDNNAENFQSKYGVSCTDVVRRPSCGSMWNSDNVWVSANGQACVTQEKNTSWQCNTGMTISLQGSANSDYCQAFVPTQNISQMEVNSTYQLPASIKRKPVTLTLNLVGDDGKGRVSVQYYRPGISAEGTFTDWTDSPCDNSTCTIEAYAGDQILLKGLNSSGATFSYWVCKSGSRNCNETPETTVGTETYQISITGDNTLEAHFNDKDLHCIYNDFKNTSVFCDGSSTDDCIDKCKTGAHCAVTDETNYPDANWVMVYANSKCDEYRYIGSIKEWCKVGHSHSNYDVFEEPIVDNSDGSISANGTEAVGSSLTSTVVLSRIQAGYNGVMTAMFNVPTLASKWVDKVLTKETNNSFIVRSNADASEYYSLSVISGVKTTARLCYATTRDNVSANCESAEFVSGLTGGNSINTALTKSSISISLTDENILVTLSYVTSGTTFGSAQVSFDLSSIDKFKNHILNDANHQYIGFKLDVPSAIQDFFETQFKIYDIAWRTTTSGYESSCWDTPTVTCSFKASNQSVGGMIPESPETATPWVGMSSWFANKDCTIDYYYNGCDVPDSRFVDQKSILHYFTNDKSACIEGDGMYYRTPLQLYSYKEGLLDGGLYEFTATGLHGYKHSSGLGYVNDASVVVRCIQEGNPHVYDARCGEFNVGNLEQCSMSYAEMLSSDYSSYCTGDGECIPTFASSTPVNVRESSIKVTIDELNAGTVHVYLLSEGNNVSQKLMTFTESGIKTATVTDQVAGSSGFDPQKVIGIIAVGEGVTSYKVTHVQSVCPYALSMACRYAPIYNDKTKQWTVSASVTHPEQASSCKITALDGAFGAEVPAATDCVESFNQLVPQTGVYSASETKSYKFRVEALDADGNVIDDCETPEKEIPVVSFATCAISSETVKQGQGVPYVSFSLTGCPTGGCDYSVTYNGTPLGDQTGTYGDYVCPSEGCDNVNKADPYDVGDEITYVVSAYGKTCEKTFKVEAAEEKPTCVVNSISDAGVLNATVSKASWTGGEIAITDVNGVQIGSSITVSSTGNPFEYDLSTLSLSAGSYRAVLRLPGGSNCSMQYTVAAPTSKTPVTIGSCSHDGGTSVANGSDVTLSASNVSGCSEGCQYAVSGTSLADNTYSYTNGSIVPVTVNGTAGGSASYTITLTNKDGESGNCTVNVAIAAATPSAGTCECATYCGSGCETNVSTGNVSGNPYTGCIFFTEATRLDIQHVGFTINNTDKSGQLCYDNATACTNALAGISKSSDGGYYISVSSAYVDVRSKGYNPCISDVKPVITSCNPATTTVVPGKAVNIQLVLSTDCNTKNGCTYTISGGSSGKGSYVSGNVSYVDGNANDGDNKSYTIALSSTAGTSEACTFNVSYDANAITDVILNYGGTLTELTAGKYHLYSNNEHTGVLRCEAATSTTVTVNGVSKTITTSRSSLDGYNPRPSTYVEMVVPAGSTVKCHTDW